MEDTLVSGYFCTRLWMAAGINSAGGCRYNRAVKLSSPASDSILQPSRRAEIPRNKLTSSVLPYLPAPLTHLFIITGSHRVEDASPAQNQDYPKL